MRKRYLNNLDYLKGLAIIGVVAIHTLGTEYPLNNDFLYIMYINTINSSCGVKIPIIEHTKYINYFMQGIST